MEAGKFSFKFSRQTQKILVGSSKYAYFKLYTFCLLLSSNDIEQHLDKVVGELKHVQITVTYCTGKFFNVSGILANLQEVLR
jgi:hypothetical protein